MTINFKLTCSVCDETLEATESKADLYGDFEIKIEPCETCIKESHNEGYEAARETFEE
jgi:hypothetical protein